VKFFLIIVSSFNSFIWILIKILPAKLILILIRFSNCKFIYLNIKKKNKYKSFIKNIFYKRRINDRFSSCLSKAITARFLFNIIGLDNNLKLGIILKDERKKIPHAWLEDKLTGEELTFKTTSKELCIFKIKL